MRTSLGTRLVTVASKPGTEDETRIAVEAHIQSRTGSFAIDTPIFVGDYVEMPNPRLEVGGVERRYVATAQVLQSGPARQMHRVKVEWGDSPAPPRVAAVRRLTFDNLHPAVQAAAGDFFADGQHQAAVSEAFKSIDVRVRDLTGIERPAVDRMAQAFKPDGSVLDVSAHEGKSGEDEQEGFMYIFRGAMWASVTPVPKNSSSRVTPSRRLSTSGSQACYTAGSTLRKPSVGRPGDRRRDIGIGCVSRGVGRTGAVAEGATQGRCATFQR